MHASALFCLRIALIAIEKIWPVFCQLETPNLVFISGRVSYRYWTNETNSHKITILTPKSCYDYWYDYGHELTVVSFNYDDKRCLFAGVTPQLVLWDRETRRHVIDVVDDGQWPVENWVTIARQQRRQFPPPLLLYMFDNRLTGTNIGLLGSVADLKDLEIFSSTYSHQDPNFTKNRWRLRLFHYMVAAYNLFPVPVVRNGLNLVAFNNKPYTVSFWLKINDFSRDIVIFEGSKHTNNAKLVLRFDEKNNKLHYFTYWYEPMIHYTSTKKEFKCRDCWSHYMFVFNRHMGAGLEIYTEVFSATDNRPDLRKAMWAADIPTILPVEFISILPYSSPIRQVCLACFSIFKQAFSGWDRHELSNACP